MGAFTHNDECPSWKSLWKAAIRLYKKLFEPFEYQGEASCEAEVSEDDSAGENCHVCNHEDKDSELMKKIARYKLNKITKELSATTVQSRPAESVGKKKSSKRLNLSVSSYPIGGL